VVLLSGGLDSATSLGVARDEGYETYALSVRYGQRHGVELEAAARVAAALGVRRHLVVSVDLGAIGGSALTDDVQVPKDQSLEEIGTGIPVTYVPARNTVFLSLALGWAEVLEAEDVFMGVTAVDYSGYPDCRPEYIRAFEAMANLATKAAVEGRQRLRIHAPLIDLDKAAIIRLGTSLGVDYGLTHSCYDPASDGRSCGRCDSCLLRLEGFRRAGLEDPLRYAS
jgi:7-cyano-7-deazaguanine synthase